MCRGYYLIIVFGRMKPSQTLFNTKHIQNVHYIILVLITYVSNLNKKYNGDRIEYSI